MALPTPLIPNLYSSPGCSPLPPTMALPTALIPNLSTSFTPPQAVPLYHQPWPYPLPSFQTFPLPLLLPRLFPSTTNHGPTHSPHSKPFHFLYSSPDCSPLP